MNAPNPIIARAMELHRVGRLIEAESLYRQALIAEPDNADALHLLGVLAYQRGEAEQAVDMIGRALDLRGIHPGYLSNLGLAYEALGRLDAAADCYREALAAYPEFGEPLCNLAFILAGTGKAEEALTYARRAVELRPDSVTAHDAYLFLMQYTWTDAETVLAAHQRYASQFETPAAARRPAHRNVRDPSRRLKVGYVSPDLRAHAVALFMEPLLTGYDRTQLDVYCYYNHPTSDAISRRHATSFGERWVSCYAMSDDELASRIMSDEIDILVDLAGHTRDNRLLVFARKPAPVQVTYLGYPTTTGLESMDYRLTSWEVDPAGSERWYTEQLYRLPRTLWCYRSPEGMDGVKGAPGLHGGYVTFGSMNNLAKVSAETIRAWGAVLRRVEGSRLVMSSVPAGRARQHLEAQFAAQGIGAGRLELHGRLPAEEFRALSDRIDIALDPFPYNGTTTTCEALCRGLPVVSLKGRTAVARSGYALLKTVGLEELCAEDEEGYVEIAAGLGKDVSRLSALRAGMRKRLEGSALRDEAGFARDVETAYRAMWRAWCET